MLIHVLGQDLLHARRRRRHEVGADDGVRYLVGEDIVGDVIDGDGDVPRAVGVKRDRGRTRRAVSAVGIGRARGPVIGAGYLRLSPVKGDAEAKVRRMHVEERTDRLHDLVHPGLGQQGVFLRVLAQEAHAGPDVIREGMEVFFVPIGNGYISGLVGLAQFLGSDSRWNGNGEEHSEGNSNDKQCRYRAAAVI